MANNKEQLFTEFPGVSTERWEEVVVKDLKGADYQKKLVWKSAEGFDVQPYYRAEDLSNLKHLDAKIGEFPYVRSATKTNKWKVYQTISVKCAKEANKIALAMLAGGVNSLGFCLSDKEFNDFDTLLNGIDIKSVELTFGGKGVISAAKAMIQKAKDLALAVEDAKFNFIIDPIVKQLSLKGRFCSSEAEEFEIIKNLIIESGDYKRMRFMRVSGHSFHNSGSTIVEELAFTLAAGHEYVAKLMEAGLTVDKAAPSIVFSMAVSSNYFMEIAKMRAARLLWATIMKPYNAHRGCATRMRLHTITSQWNQTAYDPYVNMLRGTTEAMSAAIGGVHSLEVLPFNVSYEAPTDFSYRIARNVQLLLKYESHFDNVVDPSGGSYYIETLTENIAAKAWELFKIIEDKGGYIAAFKSGMIQEAIEKSAAKKDKAISTRREILLGTNQYPNFGETKDASFNESKVVKGASCCACTCNGAEPEFTPLKPYRGGMAFEQMRLQVDRSENTPKAFMLTAGSLSMARARSQFACNFFGCAGIQTIDNTFFKNIEEGIEAAKASKAGIVVLCAADDDYAILAPAVKQALGDSAILVIAGAPACAPELEVQGITNFINVRSNVLDTLKFYLKELGI